MPTDTTTSAKVPQAVSELFTSSTQPLSFEIFPPKGELSDEEAARVAGELATLDPAFISVTYSAGGSGNAHATTDVASMIQTTFGIPTVAHLTCQGMTRTDLEDKIAELQSAGIVNILALRGDPIPDMPPGDFSCARDLIGPLVDAGFCVGAAAYPEGHISCESLDGDIAYLKEKQDAGASFLITQLFFNNEDYYRFRERADAAGITIPITCGIMPFMSKSQVSRMIFMCGASLPAELIRLLARYEGDEAALRQAGIDYAVAQLADLRDHGVDGLHIYSMNRPAVARAIVSALEG